MTALPHGHGADAGIVRLGHGQVGRPGRRDHADVPVDEGGGDRFAHHLERRRACTSAVAQAGHVTGVTDKVRDAVRVEPDEIGFDEELGRDPGVVGRHGERLEHRRGKGAEGLGGDPYVGHGSPAWGTSTRIVRITPVPLPATSASSELSAERMNNVRPSSPPSAQA